MHLNPKESSEKSRTPVKGVGCRTFLLCILLAAISKAGGQTLSLQRENLAAGGSSGHITQGNKTFLVQQSIGQAIRYSTAVAGSLVVRQGFAQPPGAGFFSALNRRPLAVEVFPNPNSGQITLRFLEPLASKADLQLFSLLGQKLFQTHLDQSPLQSLTLPPLPAGTYVLTIRCADQIFTTRIIKL